ncbi:MFS transporter [Gordonia sp. Z-3]|uniref:MFS transporter n=1 Tax=unclassified Gordonia (in: high G+C Gram-positive bacteria) TaxID=2657482 RepID=UPI000C52EF66|nr:MULTISPECIES: MFS transporter [unclassified Gordonia (in: high G+C Gram-positive bacteria)]MAU81337.1 MFS transporter [Gordonia sp. (in: high G+C Gram-positive bacteria)]MED5802177.1 MFS transporter [Gordonia sp. Z-3]
MSVSAGNQLPAALKPFALRQYRLLVLGLMLAMFADGVWTVGVVWQVIELGGGPGQLAVVTGVAAVGMVVSTLAGGILADRVSQRRIMIGLELVKLAAFGIVGVAGLLGVLSLPVLIGASLLGGITMGMYYPAYSALLPSVVEAAQLQAANGIEGFLRPVIFQAIGPIVVGGAISMASPAAAIVLAGVASASSALAYVAMTPVTVRRDLTATTAHPVRSVVTDLLEGFAYMWRTPWLWATLFFACILVLAVMGPIEVLVPFALRELGAGASDHALVLTGFGIGAASASLVFASIPMPRRYLSVMFGIWSFSSVPLVIMGVADATWMFVAAGLLMGVMFDGPMVLWGTLLQRRVPPELLGRVASLDFFVSVALMPVSMAVAAPISHAIGLTATFVLAGLLPVPVAGAFYLAARLWRDEIEHPLRVVLTDVTAIN